MAFIIPMLGKSSRFFKEGYTLPKHQLKINKSSLFTISLSSFQRYFKSDLFIFLVRNDFKSEDFVKDEVKKLGIINYLIQLVNFDTKGQAETVSLSLNLIDDNEPIYIFNIDTCRVGFLKSDFANYCDGYLEVFKGAGDAWSFVLPGKNNLVLQTSEKDRISSLCSNGLYFFKNKKTFFDAYDNALKDKRMVNGEYYVAPLYNYLIDRGLDIRYDLIGINKMKFFGTPKEYEKLLSTTKLP